MSRSMEAVLHELRGRTLPPVLYGTLFITASGGLGTGMSVVRGEAPLGLSLGYLTGTMLLLGALALMRSGSPLWAARLAGITWILTSVTAGVYGTSVAVAAIVPGTLVISLAVAAVFDEESVVPWAVVAAATWIGIALTRTLIGHPIDSNPAYLALIALVPALCLLVVGLALRASAIHSQTAFLQAESHRLAVEHVNRELVLEGERLAKARDNVIEANRAKSAFLANMSHELRTPLNAIVGYSEMVREELFDEGLTKLVDDVVRVENAGRHLLSLINDILDLSKIEAGQLQLHVIEFAPEDLFDDVLTTIRPLSDRKDITLRVDVEDDLPRMSTDDVRLKQILLNLLSNAVKFTESGRVTFSAGLSDDKRDMLVQVTDTGIGMTPSQSARVFRPFVQAEDTTTRRFGGTGLGLSISQTLADAMGGEITVDSELGVGSTFTLRIPLWSGRTESSGSDATLRLGETGGPLVLVIDDDADARELHRRTLAAAGYSVAEASSGEVGLAVARSQRPAAVVLDVRMPGMDGWAVLQALKADDALKQIPVVLATVLSSPQRGLAMGAAEYLKKPIDRRQLRRVVRQVCTDPRRPILVVDDDPDVRDLLTRTLRDDGWTTAEAEDGRAGLAQVQEADPAAVLLDLMMANTDGFGFLEGLRDLDIHVPVIVITAKELTRDDHSRLEGHKVLRKGDLSYDELLSDLGRIVGATATDQGAATGS